LAGVPIRALFGFSGGHEEWTLTPDGVLRLQVYDEEGRLHSGIKATVIEERPFPEDRDPVHREPGAP
jgi:hypothetical protein